MPESTSPCAVPDLLASKKWILANVHVVSKIRVTFSYIFPHLDDMLDNLSSACTFLKLI